MTTHTHHVDSGLLCSMFASDSRDVSGIQSGTSSGPLHQSVNFEYGLRGVKVSGSQVVKMLLQISCLQTAIEFIYRSLEFQRFCFSCMSAAPVFPCVTPTVI